MEVTRYVNGVKVEKEDMKKITIANPIVLAILHKIDERIATLNNQPKNVVANKEET
jgi:hypothetical protein